MWPCPCCMFGCAPLAELGYTNLVWTAQKPERIALLCAQAEIRERSLNKGGLIRGRGRSLGGQSAGRDKPVPL